MHAWGFVQIGVVINRLKTLRLQRFHDYVVRNSARKMGQYLRFSEPLAGNLLVGRGHRTDKVVSDRDLLMLNKEDALIGFRPHPIQTLDLILSISAPFRCLPGFWGFR